MIDGTVNVSANLVPHLRAGVKREIGRSLSILLVEVETPHTDAQVYRAARVRYDAATALFDVIGLDDRADQPELKIDLAPWPRLLLRALETQRDIEVLRLERAEEEGLKLSRRDLPDLAKLVEEVRRRTGAQPQGDRQLTFLQRKLKRRGRPRARGDG